MALNLYRHHRQEAQQPIRSNPAQVNLFTVEFEQHAVINTQKYRLLLAKLKAFATARGYIMIDQWTPIYVR